MLPHPAKARVISTNLDAENWHGTKMSSGSHNVPIAKPQNYVINPTNPRRALDDGIEHRLHVRRRSADDAEHLGGCRLMLQGFAQFCVALLDLFEKADVLDGDDGLRGKGLKQFDLLLGERADLQAADMNRPDGNSLAQQRRGERCPNADTSGEARWKVILWHCCQVINVKGLPANNGSGGYILTVYWN